MAYHLGIDLGTVYSVAAVRVDGNVQAIDLGSRSTAIPSVVNLDSEGAFRVGDDAARRLVSEPERTAREFKRRFGDPTPLILGGTPVAAEALQAELLRYIVDVVTTRMGRPAERIVVTHPANWGPFKRDLMNQVVTLAGLDDVELLSEPEAAALHYAAQERIEAGGVLAVYDLGGGTFDAVVLTRTAEGYQITGEPGGLEHLGGADFDQAVLAHVVAALGEEFPAEDDRSREALGALLRRECVEAKEALSSDTATTLSVPLPTGVREVRLTRTELEEMLRSPLTRTVTELRRVLQRAGVAPAELQKILLVGGSSRIPLVARLVTEELGVSVAVDIEPKLSVAMGAALWAGRAESVSQPVAPEAAALPLPVPAAVPAATPDPLAGSVAGGLLVLPRDRGSRRPLLVGLAAAGVVAVVVAWLALRGGDDPAPGAAPTSVPTSAVSVDPIGNPTDPPVVSPTGGTGGQPTPPPSSVPTSAPPPRAPPTGVQPKDIAVCSVVGAEELATELGRVDPLTQDFDDEGKYCKYSLPETGPDVTAVVFATYVGVQDPDAYKSQATATIDGYPVREQREFVDVLVDDSFTIGVYVENDDTTDWHDSLVALTTTYLRRIRP